MSDVIDLGKAPEGYPIWIQGKDSYYASGWHRELSDRYQSPTGRYYMKRDFAVFTVHTCPQQTQWSGEGLPPVGTVCEYRVNDGPWYKCEIRYIVKAEGEAVIAYCQHLEMDQILYEPICTFRQIRAAEQIAAEEREAAVDEMAKCAKGMYFPNRYLLGDLYDAGYRKQ